MNFGSECGISNGTFIYCLQDHFPAQADTIPFFVEYKNVTAMMLYICVYYHMSCYGQFRDMLYNGLDT